MRPIFLACPDGEPTSASTWSGTPLRLLTEIQKRGRLAGSLDTSALPPRIARFCWWIAKHVFGGDLAYAYSPVTRFFRALRLHRKLGRAPLNVLHTGTLGMPLVWRRRDQEHFLFCDTTWHLAAVHSPDLKQLGPVLRRLAEWMDRRSYSQMAHIFTIGRHVRDDLISHYGVSPDRVTAVGTGRGSIEAYAGAKRYDNGEMLFVAKLRAQEKGVALVAAAFAMAVRRNRNLKLTLIGRDEYAHFAAEIPNVAAKAFVSAEELQKAFEKASLFVMPARYEPWGLVYLEALACRTPIVALDRNAGPEFCDNGRSGFLLEREDPEALAALMVEAFADPADLAKKGEHGQRLVREAYRWDRTTDQIIHAMDRVGHD
ncbi:MAG TPA: glycosyltransferase family 4 protein [Nevskiaceae bacterium]|nr:glycosyltransferase family 4 protein [Nevskiaceae bacterium]